tara:strand:+ start:373 stop:540 length:168 start_codon:yes stop_codon:yes gene_type:complete
MAFEFQDTMYFELYKYERETTLTKMNFGAIMSSSLPLKSEFDGHLGLAPASANVA